MSWSLWDFGAWVELEWAKNRQYHICYNASEPSWAAMLQNCGNHSQLSQHSVRFMRPGNETHDYCTKDSNHYPAEFLSRKHQFVHAAKINTSFLSITMNNLITKFWVPNAKAKQRHGLLSYLLKHTNANRRYSNGTETLIDVTGSEHNRQWMCFFKAIWGTKTVSQNLLLQYCKQS